MNISQAKNSRENRTPSPKMQRALMALLTPIGVPRPLAPQSEKKPNITVKNEKCEAVHDVISGVIAEL